MHGTKHNEGMTCEKNFKWVFFVVDQFIYKRCSYQFDYITWFLPLTCPATHTSTIDRSGKRRAANIICFNLSWLQSRHSDYNQLMGLNVGGHIAPIPELLFLCQLFEPMSYSSLCFPILIGSMNRVKVLILVIEAESASLNDYKKRTRIGYTCRHLYSFTACVDVWCKVVC